MQDIIRHASGLEFERPADYSRLWQNAEKLRCFGKLLEHPQFTDVNGLRALKLDSVRIARVYIEDESGRQVEDEKHRAVVSKVSGRVYCYPSPVYVPVQDADMIRSFADVAEERGLKTIGSFTGIGTGQTRGHVVLANPEFRVRLLERYQDDIMLGVNMTNSYDTSAGVRMEAFGVRMVCTNYNLWGDLLGSIYQQHINFNAERLNDAVGEFLNGLVDRSPVLSNIVEGAINTPVITAEVEDLLWAIKLPRKGIEAISANPRNFCPEIEKLGLNAYTLYNAATAYLTWGKQNGAQYVETTVDYTRNALQLLTESHDKLIEKGRELRERAKEREKERQENLRVVLSKGRN